MDIARGQWRTGRDKVHTQTVVEVRIGKAMEASFPIHRADQGWVQDAHIHNQKGVAV